MKNKLLLGVFALAVLLTSCQERPDILGVNSQLANKNLQGFYVYVCVDSVNMATIIHEWNLVNDLQKGRVGYYRVAATGNGLEDDVTDSLTWEEAVMAEDCLSMHFPVTFPPDHQEKVWGVSVLYKDEVTGKYKSLPVVKDVKNKMLKWGDGVLYVDNYFADAELISKANVMRTVEEHFQNRDFVHCDTTYYITIKEDTIRYLAWATKNEYQTLEYIEEYNTYLESMADTIAWFNQNYNKTGKDIPTTVKHKPTPETSGPNTGKYLGSFPRAYVDSFIGEIKTIHGPLRITNGEFVVNRANKNNTGSYFYHEETWTEECYTKPNDTAAIHLDSLVQVLDAQWTPLAYTNAKKFDMLFKGKGHTSALRTIGGQTVKDVSEDKEVFFLGVPITNYDRDDQTLMHNGLKFKNK